MTDEQDAITEPHADTGEPANLEHYIRTDSGLFWKGADAGWTPDPDQAMRIESSAIEGELQNALDHAGESALYAGTWPPTGDA